jgi:uncharacterized membrane protein YozB (DUF420 family)
MDSGLLYWTAALTNLAVVCLCAIVGVRCVRRGELARHLRAMKIASGLVVAFLVSYVVKLGWIGREDRSAWSSADVWLLRAHESFVLVMLVAGAVAWLQAGKLAGTRQVTRSAKDPDADPGALRTHKRAGWTAVLSAIVGFALAIGVLVGMYRRAAL